MLINTHKNILTAYGTIWGGDGMYFVNYLSRLEKDYSDITVKLHTNGGTVFDGNLIYNALNQSSANIKIQIVGIAASMGGIIMLSRPSKDVEIVENGYVMLHAPASGGGGNAQDFENQAKLLRSVEANFLKKLIARTGKSIAQVKKWMTGDNWFDADECLALGLVGKIIQPQVETALPIENVSQMPSQEVYNMYACLLTAKIGETKNVKSNKNSDMKQLLITALALANVTDQSSDTAIIEAINNALQIERNEKEAAITALKDYKTAEIKAVLDKAEKDGIIEAEKRNVYQTIGEKSGIEALHTVLPSKKENTPPNITDLLNKGKGGNGSETRANWDFDKWQKEDPKGLEAMADKTPAEYEKLFNAKYTRK